MTKVGEQIASIGSSGGNSGGNSGQGSDDRKGYYHGSLGYLPEIYKPGSGMIYDLSSKYATGGLNTVTGLAWLDGTPSEPEYVLNARQTDAFLKLADVLPSMINGTSNNTSNTFGATYVNFSVNLESVSPDYDVDRMVDLVKDKLYDSATYRNNNVLSFLR